MEIGLRNPISFLRPGEGLWKVYQKETSFSVIKKKTKEKKGNFSTNATRNDQTEGHRWRDAHSSAVHTGPNCGRFSRYSVESRWAAGQRSGP
jgi:hypothetical protein